MQATFIADQRDYPLKTAFILDSGSTTHVCNSSDRFITMRRATAGDYIWAGNNQVWIQGYGTVAVKAQRQGQDAEQTIHLDGVAWCPDFLSNLL
jgi:hypothetical protein